MVTNLLSATNLTIDCDHVFDVNEIVCATNSQSFATQPIWESWTSSWEITGLLDVLTTVEWMTHVLHTIFYPHDAFLHRGGSYEFYRLGLHFIPAFKHLLSVSSSTLNLFMHCFHSLFPYFLIVFYHSLLLYVELITLIIHLKCEGFISILSQVRLLQK